MTTPTIVLLHGGGGSAAAMEPLAELLRPSFRVEALNLVGHGGRPIPAKIRFADWPPDLLAQLDERKIGRAIFFGYSIAGTLALHLARHHPERVSAVVTLGTRYGIDKATGAHFAALCDPQKVIDQAGTLAGVLEKIHQPNDWKVLYRTMAEFYPALAESPPLTDADLRQIRCPVLVMTGGREVIAPVADAMKLAMTLPHGHTMVFPRFAHPLKAAPLKYIAAVTTAWLGNLPA